MHPHVGVLEFVSTSGIFSLGARVGFVGKKGKALMHLTDPPDLPSALLVERMVMPVMRRRKHSTQQTTRCPLPWPDIHSAPEHYPAQPPTFQLNGKIPANP